MSNFLFQFGNSSLWLDKHRTLSSEQPSERKTHEWKIKGHCLKWEFTARVSLAPLSDGVVVLFSSLCFAYCCCCLLGQETWAQHLGLSLRQAQNGHVSTLWGQFLSRSTRSACKDVYHSSLWLDRKPTSFHRILRKAQRAFSETTHPLCNSRNKAKSQLAKTRKKAIK